jgi:dTDP-4-dehydrorhamnose reductase
MSNAKILILGDGLLGTEIRKQTGWDYISRKKDGFSIGNFIYRKDDYYDKLTSADVLVNCIGYTNTYDKNWLKHYQSNYLGVLNLVDFCNSSSEYKKLIHISTDYIYADTPKPAKETDIPIHKSNWYSYFKLLADGYVQTECGYYLLVRTSFKPKPFPHLKATTALKGNFDYVDVISCLIIGLIENNAVGVYNVGTEEKTMYDLAVQTRPHVEKVDYLFNTTMPTDVTMDLSKMKEFFEYEN